MKTQSSLYFLTASTTKSYNRESIRLGLSDVSTLNSGVDPEQFEYADINFWTVASTTRG